jgi:hypothetical protein
VGKWPFIGAVLCLLAIVIGAGLFTQATAPKDKTTRGSIRIAYIEGSQFARDNDVARQSLAGIARICFDRANRDYPLSLDSPQTAENQAFWSGCTVTARRLGDQ